MKTHELLIVRHFLQTLDKQVEGERLQEPIAPAFLNLLTRADLKEILVLIYGDPQEIKKAHPDYENKPNDVLLFEYIRDEYYVLKYYIDVVMPRYTL